jgi:N utilization substance protein B
VSDPRERPRRGDAAAAPEAPAEGGGPGGGEGRERREGRPAGTYRGGLGSRREARERALALLYEAEAKGLPPAEVLAGLPLPPDPFTVALVEGVGAHRAELDDLLRRYARDWKLERMPAIDRAVLRMGAYELCHRPDVPTAAVLSEAVELAARYSTADSGRFVNGMLAAIAAEVRPG